MKTGAKRQIFWCDAREHHYMNICNSNGRGRWRTTAQQLSALNDKNAASSGMAICALFPRFALLIGEALPPHTPCCRFTTRTLEGQYILSRILRRGGRL
jgi:hypothetical protein